MAFTHLCGTSSLDNRLLIFVHSAAVPSQLIEAGLVEAPVGSGSTVKPSIKYFDPSYHTHWRAGQ